MPSPVCKDGWDMSWWLFFCLFVFELRKWPVQHNGNPANEEGEDECSDVLQVVHSGL